MKINKHGKNSISVNIRPRIDDLVRTVMAIDAQQEVQPGYCLDISRSIVASELNRLWVESYGRDLDPSGRI